jgi:hypothetical protein
MKILFYNPAPEQKRYLPHQAPRGSTFFRRPNYDAMRLAAVCRDHQFIYYDERVEEKPGIIPDAVVINVPLYLSSYIKETSRKKWGRKPALIWHGFYPTLFPKDCATYADAVVIGDVVNIWSHISHDLEHNTLRSTYRSNQQHLFNVDRRIEERNGLTPVLSQLRTSMGCACNEKNKDFCQEHILYPDVIHDDMERVIHDVASIKRKIIQIRDDDFLIDQEYALTFLDRCWRYKKMWIIQSGKRLFADMHILHALKDCGVRIIYIKEDWISDEVHDHIDDKDFWQQKRREISMLHRKRIACGALLRLGREGETHGFYEKLLRHLVRSKIDFIKVKVIMPIPKTTIFKRYKKQGRIVTDTSQYDQWKPVLKYSTFSGEDLYSWMERFRDRFYSWDSILVRNLFVTTHLGIYNSFFFYLIPNMSFRNNFLEKAGYPP